MFYQPDLIVYLWLLPVTFLVIIPATLAACRFGIGCIKDTASEVEEDRYGVKQEVVAEA